MFVGNEILFHVAHCNIWIKKGPFHEQSITTCVGFYSVFSILCKFLYKQIKWTLILQQFSVSFKANTIATLKYCWGCWATGNIIIFGGWETSTENKIKNHIEQKIWCCVWLANKDDLIYSINDGKKILCIIHAVFP